MIASIFKYAFLQNALIACILSSIACGIIGTVIMEKKLVMMSGGIAHASFGGIGLGFLLGVEPIFTALLFSVGTSLSISEINKRSKTNPDLLTGIFWSVGMALGILFISLTPGYPPDMSSYLFGDILTVSRNDLITMIALDIVIIFLIFAGFNMLKAYMFDREFASVLRLPVNFLDYMVYILIALTVVVLIRVAGIILVIALLTAPPATARLFSYNLKNIMLISILTGLVLCLTGLFISYSYNIPSGAVIVLVSGAAYLVSALIKRLINKIRLSSAV
ncbi:MAG TPA: metal ABC transporter permease [Clostridiaceae bacterium]|nr:metal ABC transporter permease [Clostridiaceae bacterium]